MGWVRSVCIPLIALVFASPAIAEQGKLRERLTPEVMAVVYPGAERLGMEEGSPPAIAVFKGDQIVAYVFSTLDIIAATGYVPHRPGPRRRLGPSRHHPIRDSQRAFVRDDIGFDCRQGLSVSLAFS